jgi:rubrerythrin
MNDTLTRAPGLSRRRFIGYAGALAGLTMAAGIAGCHREEDALPADARINLGEGDVGMLNYAYALEQLEAAFYEQVSASFYDGISNREQAYLSQIRDHEIAHRALFKTVLGSQAIPALTPDFSSIDFSSRSSVLEAARTFEDLGVSAYNGAGIYFRDPQNLGLAAKIVSVEARHAAIIRELLQPLSFADTSVLNPISRVDSAQTPQQALEEAGKFFRETLNADNLKKP